MQRQRPHQNGNIFSPTQRQRSDQWLLDWQSLDSSVETFLVNHSPTLGSDQWLLDWQSPASSVETYSGSDQWLLHWQSLASSVETFLVNDSPSQGSDQWLLDWQCSQSSTGLTQILIRSLPQFPVIIQP